MSDNLELAKYIYKRLKDKGASISNASIFIIENAIDNFMNSQQTKSLDCNQDTAMGQSKNCNQ